MLRKSKEGQRGIKLVLESQEYFLEQILGYIGSPGRLVKTQTTDPHRRVSDLHFFFFFF